jgi:hypothetical protein
MEPSAHARDEIALLETERAELETLFVAGNIRMEFLES